LDALYLVGLGFVVGLSGAMLPGPLLVYTIAESLRRGWKTGVYVIAGHAAVEVVLMLALAAGVSALMSSEFFVRAVSLLGGGFMVYTAWNLARSRWNLKAGEDARGHGTFMGGVLFTAFNPGVPLWWATAGARLILEGMRNAGYAGAALVFSGHLLADFSCFTLVSILVSRGRERLFERCAGTVKAALALLLAAIGAYFTGTAIWPQGIV
jgi:threonine/homoserine/homoserine lactone efflux protein